MGEKTKETDLCSSRTSIAQDMEAAKKEQFLTLKMIKEKIMSTDKLIKKYQQKCDDFDNKVKENMELREKLESRQRNEQELREQLHQSRQSTEPLNKNVKRLVQEKFTAEARIEQLKQDITSKEAVISDLRRVVSVKEDKECALLLEQQVQARDLQRERKMVEKMNIELSNARERIQKEKGSTKTTARELRKANKRAAKFEIQVNCLKEELKSLNKQLKQVSSGNSLKVSTVRRMTQIKKKPSQRDKKQSASPEIDTAHLLGESSDSDLSDYENTAIDILDKLGILQFPVLSPLPPSGNDSDTSEQSSGQNSGASSIGDLGDLLEAQLDIPDSTRNIDDYKATIKDSGRDDNRDCLTSVHMTKDVKEYGISSMSTGKRNIMVDTTKSEKKYKKTSFLKPEILDLPHVSSNDVLDEFPEDCAKIQEVGLFTPQEKVVTLANSNKVVPKYPEEETTTEVETRTKRKMHEKSGNTRQKAIKTMVSSDGGVGENGLPSAEGQSVELALMSSDNIKLQDTQPTIGETPLPVDAKVVLPVRKKTISRKRAAPFNACVIPTRITRSKARQVPVEQKKSNATKEDVVIEEFDIRDKIGLNSQAEVTEKSSTNEEAVMVDRTGINLKAEETKECSTFNEEVTVDKIGPEQQVGVKEKCRKTKKRVTADEIGVKSQVEVKELCRETKDVLVNTVCPDKQGELRSEEDAIVDKTTQAEVTEECSKFKEDATADKMVTKSKALSAEGCSKTKDDVIDDKMRVKTQAEVIAKLKTAKGATIVDGTKYSAKQVQENRSSIGSAKEDDLNNKDKGTCPVTEKEKESHSASEIGEFSNKEDIIKLSEWDFKTKREDMVSDESHSKSIRNANTDTELNLQTPLVLEDIIDDCCTTDRTLFDEKHLETQLRYNESLELRPGSASPIDAVGTSRTIVILDATTEQQNGTTPKDTQDVASDISDLNSDRQVHSESTGQKTMNDTNKHKKSVSSSCLSRNLQSCSQFDGLGVHFVSTDKKDSQCASDGKDQGKPAGSVIDDKTCLGKVIYSPSDANGVLSSNCVGDNKVEIEDITIGDEYEEVCIEENFSGFPKQSHVSGSNEGNLINLCEVTRILSGSICNMSADHDEALDLDAEPQYSASNDMESEQSACSTEAGLPSISSLLSDDNLFSDPLPPLSPLPPSPPSHDISSPLSPPSSISSSPDSRRTNDPSQYTPFSLDHKRNLRKRDSETNMSPPGKKPCLLPSVEGVSLPEGSPQPDVVKKKGRKSALATRPSLMNEKSYSMKVLKGIRRSAVPLDVIIRRLSDVRGLSNALPFVLALMKFDYSDDLMPHIIQRYSSRSHYGDATDMPLLPVYERGVVEVVQSISVCNHLKNLPAMTISMLSKAVLSNCGGSTPDKRVLASYCRLVTALCRWTSDMSHVRILVYNILRSLHFTSGSKVYLIISIAWVWPAVFSSCSPTWSYDRGSFCLSGPPFNPLRATMQMVISVWIRESERVLLGNIMDWICQWPPAPPTSQILRDTARELSKLIKDQTFPTLENDKDGFPVLGMNIFETIKSLELLAFVLGWEWTNNVLTREVIWGLLRDWRKETSDQSDRACRVSEASVVAAVRLLGLVGRMMILQSQPVIPHVLDLLVSLLSCPQASDTIKLAVGHSLLDISPWQPTKICEILETWRASRQSPIPRSISEPLQCLGLALHQQQSNQNQLALVEQQQPECYQQRKQPTSFTRASGSGVTDNACETTANVEQRQTSQGQSALSVEQQQTSQEEPILSIEQQQTSQEEPALSMEQQQTSKKPTLGVEQQQTSQEEPILSMKQQQTSQEEPILSMEQHQTSQEEPALSMEQQQTSKKPTLGVEQQQTSQEEPILSMKQQQTSQEEPILSMEQQRTSQEEPALSMEQQQTSKKPTLGVEQQQTSQEEPILSMKQQQTSQEEPILSMEQHQTSQEEPILSMEQQQKESGLCVEQQQTSKEEPALGVEQQLTSKEESAPSVEQQQTSKEESDLCVEQQQTSQEEPIVSMEQQQTSKDEPDLCVSQQQTSQEEQAPTVEQQQTIQKGPIQKKPLMQS
ncbi:uncharacterized protein LOC116616081 [Nematostella vectensis]|uniref:uncharacterized protein LOC116616081 n=1 Tax=Nematostella vectensis TaxID=45351 RepID=UPI0020776B2B|nr:uncharacterized protein LOC116616081 [Nematostella vectensis]